MSDKTGDAQVIAHAAAVKGVTRSMEALQDGSGQAAVRPAGWQRLTHDAPGQSDTPTLSDSYVIKRALPIRARAEASHTVTDLLRVLTQLFSFSTSDAKNIAGCNAMEEGCWKLDLEMHGPAIVIHSACSSHGPHSKGLARM